MMVDTATGRLLDYVQLAGSGLDAYVDVNSDLTQVNANLWKTNATGTNNILPYGIYQQMGVSMGLPTFSPTGWTQYPLGAGQNTIGAATTAFNDFFKRGNTTPSIQTPYVAFSKYYRTFTYSVRDPFVHYTVADLSSTAPGPSTNPISVVNYDIPNVFTNVMQRIYTNRYQPWGVVPNVTGLEWSYKDPMAFYPGSYQFPSNKYPTVGWLGRVHRGTPWQTVNLKAINPDATTWTNWTSDAYQFTSNYCGLQYLTNNSFSNVVVLNDASFSMPTNDYLLMDLFTTSPNDNASKGQLSINQIGMGPGAPTAAWAAVLAGVVGVANTNTGGTLTPAIIDIPTAENLATAITALRTSTNYNGTFTSLGQICAVSNLTLTSPLLTPNQPINDAAYEFIPQQIMSLLRVGSPRYVVFAYGQSLKPADRSIVTSGSFFGMCTNYQITGEVAARAVVRFDNFPVPGGNGTQPRAVVESFNILPPE
jgi:hypothetical protein